MNEKVLVIETKKITEALDLPSTGFKELTDIEIFKKNIQFLDRNIAEYDPNFKQIIPYCAIRNSKGLLVVKRTKKQSEKRLHNKISIGIGGHINDSDLGEEIIENAMYRELFEELIMTREDILSVTPLGIINDDSNDVGKVHLGLAFEIFLNCDVSIREKDKMEGEVIPPSQLSDQKEKMETWSQILYQNHYE
jgi:predicted NUDIX family phosphoesterase